jgi:hypothetical protein
LGIFQCHSILNWRINLYDWQRFFLPIYEKLIAVGVWSFFWGAFFYAIVTVHDLLESISNFKSQDQVSNKNITELLSAVMYTIGTFLFISGSLFFLPQIKLMSLGAWCFIIGSILFFVGASINVLQIIQAGSLLTLQLLNATAICFVVGSTLFIVASIPYLWTVEPDQNELLRYVAWQYIIGSLLFFTGGIFNYYRVFEATNYYRNMALLKREAE